MIKAVYSIYIDFTWGDNSDPNEFSLEGLPYGTELFIGNAACSPRLFVVLDDADEFRAEKVEAEFIGRIEAFGGKVEE